MTTRTEQPLTRREREILDVLFELQNRASAEEIRARLIDPPSYSAVRALLARLEAKDRLRHVGVDGRYIYSATQSKLSAAKAALRHPLRTFFAGSRSRMVTALLREGDWTEAELEQLQAEIDRARKEAKS